MVDRKIYRILRLKTSFHLQVHLVNVSAFLALIDFSHVLAYKIANELGLILR